MIARLYSVLLVLLSGSQLMAHGIPIDVVVEGDQLAPFSVDGQPTFDLGILEGSRLIGAVFGDSPGIGVTNAANGIPSGTILGLDITAPLSFWNTEITETDASLEITSPDGEAYVVTSDSGMQSGIIWGKYNGQRFWEAHGLYFLQSNAPVPGLYGTLARLTSPMFEPSDPFLLSFLYDPFAEYTEDWLNSGLDALADSFSKSTSDDLEGDIDGDGQLDGDDIDLLCAQHGTGPGEFDLTNDGQTNLLDIARWLDEAQTINGDTDLDGEVAFPDFLTLSGNFGETGSAATWTLGNVDCDDEIAFPDFLLLSGNFGNAPLVPNSTSASVPEPASKSASLAGILLGLALFLTSRRRR